MLAVVMLLRKTNQYFTKSRQSFSYKQYYILIHIFSVINRSIGVPNDQLHLLLYISTTTSHCFSSFLKDYHKFALECYTCLRISSLKLNISFTLSFYIWYTKPFTRIYYNLRFQVKRTIYSINFERKNQMSTYICLYLFTSIFSVFVS